MSEEWESVTNEEEILSMQVWQLFNSAIVMYLDDKDAPYFELYVNGRAFRLTINIDELEDFDIPKDRLN